MTENALLIPTPRSDASLPRLIADAGPAAAFAWDEFFRGQVRNPHTRTAYSRAVRALLAWLEDRQIPLAMVTPGMLGGYFDELSGSAPTKKLALAAIRRFYDALTLRHVVAFNPAASVRGERYEVVEGKTPAISPDQARALLGSIDAATAAGVRDRAVIACLIYTAARAGAVAKLRAKDFAHDGTQHVLRFSEKGGKAREIPVRHDLERYLLDYLAIAGMPAPTAPLIRSLVRRTGAFTDRPMTGTDVWRMVKRRLKDAELPPQICPHSFRVATVTDLLSQGVPLADVQYLAGHADPRTTRLYDRRDRAVSRNLVERISI
ncbi:MAG TPA: tyrosine-type recombinase/integrase [Urbifossiella sp.]|jgi:site-specific recombinase XerD|nr:tyrosine-type recombinase/integrase [Urbifossiella sp.]